MSVKKREAGSLTGSQRFKEEKENTVGGRAKKLAETIGSELKPLEMISQAANAVTTGVSEAKEAVIDTKQALSALIGGEGYKNGYASSDLASSQNPYGSIQVPKVDFNGLVPTNLLNPEGLPGISEEQFTQGLSSYARATRVAELYEAGFNYVNKVGTAKQAFHKAQSSVIKAATEETRVKQNIVKFDIENVRLEQGKEKLTQENEVLKQEQIKTLASKNETEQTRQFLEAKEGLRTVQIDRIKAQTNDIIQKYLKDSIQGVVA